ncbi:hypothetical protein BDQ12DRAFT_680095 [Crucibulum laeve]|uniref:AN1-type domain-containing protein n=1 Tax=Crucibulum laeve TaxID=68775 RepID=A0A5C3M661_9AGAR|nr:hypothetical protein BDQ12DRAFT_680095 [Crucibulum laeve]
MSTSPASRATPTAERDEQLLSIGKQCADPACLLVDFLPFKCQHCSLSFCQEHFRVEAHRCKEYDESKHNRVAPNCPLCNTPVAIPPGQDPNTRMESHFTNECSVMTGKTKTKSSPVCAKGNCKKVLFSPIRCDKCRSQFCPSHRFPSDHNCVAASRPAPSPSNSRPLANFATSAKNLNTKATAAGAAIKKSVAAASTSASARPVAPPARPAAASSNNPATSKSTTSNPFSKTDRLSAHSTFLAAPDVNAALNNLNDTNTTTTATSNNNTWPNNNTSNPTPNNRTDSEPKPKPLRSHIMDAASFKPRPIFAY